LTRVAATNRVLHLIDTGGPGGAETIFLEVATGLDPARWRSTVVVPARDWLFASLEERGVRPLILEGRGSFDLGYLARLRALLRSDRVDLIQTHLLGSAVYGSLVARLAGVPVVCTFHGRADLPVDEPYRAAKLRILRRPSNRLVFVSHALRRWFIEAHGIDPSRTAVIHNGIDVERFVPRRDDALRRELGISTEAILVGAIGNLRRPKRYDVLLKAAAILRDRSDEYRFVIAGEGGNSLERELLGLRRDLGLEDTFLFAGFRPDARSVLEALDVYCLCSSFEGFSLSTLEAVASGVPVVVTRSGGPEEIVEEGRSGSLVPPESPRALADAIERVVAGERRTGSSRIEHRRRADVERFSIDAMVRGYASAYEEVLAARAA